MSVRRLERDRGLDLDVARQSLEFEACSFVVDIERARDAKPAVAGGERDCCVDW